MLSSAEWWGVGLAAFFSFSFSILTASLGRGLYYILLFYIATEMLTWGFIFLKSRNQFNKFFFIKRIAIFIFSIAGYLFGRWCMGDSRPTKYRSHMIESCNSRYFWEWLVYE